MAKIHSFTQITGTTGTSNSSVVNTGESTNHTFSYTVGSAGTVVLAFQGSLSGENFFTLLADSDSATISANVAEANGQFTVTADGTYYANFRNIPLVAIRVQQVSASGTVVTTDVKYTGE